MAGGRIPVPFGIGSNTSEIDAGTLAKGTTPPPVPIGQSGSGLSKAGDFAYALGRANSTDPFFEKKYLEDKANQKYQTKSEYLEWVEKFYAGSWVADGWTDQSTSLIEKVTLPANKSAVAATLSTLGKTIAAEWAKDNHVRKINTDDLKKWGNQLKSAKSADDGSGSKITATLGNLKKEVDAKLGN